MRRHCRNCKSYLGVWEVKCPCCHRPAVRWLHLAALGAASLTAAFYFLVVVQ